MKRLLLLGLILLTACGGTPAPSTSSDSAATMPVHSQPRDEGVVLTFELVPDGNPAIAEDQPTVRVSASKFDAEDPNFKFPHFKIKGEGINLDFDWKLEELYMPELVEKFENLNDYDLTGTINGQKVFVQRIQREGNVIRVEFEFYSTLTPEAPSSDGGG